MEFEELMKKPAELDVDKFQYLDSLTLEEYDGLVENIKRYGVLSRVLVDEAGAVLDGHHRVRACRELGLDVPVKVMTGLTDDEKDELSVSQNLARRNLTRAEKIEKAAELHDRGWSNVKIATAFGVHRSLIGKWLQRRVEISTPSNSTDSEDGGEEPSPKPAPEIQQDPALIAEVSRQTGINVKLREEIAELAKQKSEQSAANERLRIKLNELQSVKPDEAEINRRVSDKLAELAKQAEQDTSDAVDEAVKAKQAEIDKLTAKLADYDEHFGKLADLKREAEARQAEMDKLDQNLRGLHLAENADKLKRVANEAVKITEYLKRTAGSFTPAELAEVPASYWKSVKIDINALAYSVMTADEVIDKLIAGEVKPVELDTDTIGNAKARVAVEDAVQKIKGLQKASKDHIFYVKDDDEEGNFND